jgi:hypothetical protein
MAFELDVFRRELRELLERHNVAVGVRLEGDTHGLDQTFVVAENNGNGKEHDLGPGSYVDQYDLK